MYFLYILKSLANDRYYVGSTNNLERRLKEHNTGKSKYTKLTKPFILVFSKKYKTLKKAQHIERKLKRFKSRTVLDKIVSEQTIRLRS